jgi:hypothetical protein
MDILHKKMANDLVKMSFEYVSQDDRYNALDKDWLLSRIQVHMKEHKMSIPELGMCVSKHNPDTRCCARLWKNKTGKDQCTHARMLEDGVGDYCDKHHRMLKLDGVLRFGDIREGKPTHDLIKLNKGICEELHWIEPDPIQQLQHVLNHQSHKVIVTAPRLVVN